jgi:hypothetical protein
LESDVTTPAPPPRIARLPKDKHGRPVPWFVAFIEGVPDFRIVAQGKVIEAARFEKCFVCGEGLGRRVTFPVGPMSTVNRTAPEPPTHKECALYAVVACPFLARPGMRRRQAGLPEGLTLETHGPGVTAAHNPGVTALWTTRSRSSFADDKGGLLFRMGDPDEVVWFAEGRPATRAEVAASLDEEHQLLRQLVEQAPGSAHEVAALQAAYTQALQHLPDA